MDLPPEFDPALYRERHTDLQIFNDAEIARHYEEFGQKEGRVAFEPHSREAFLRLIPPEAAQLEIGPFLSPCLKSEERNVKYFDILEREHLIARAQSLIDFGAVDAEAFSRNIAEARHIHYVHPTGDLRSVTDATFEYVLSCHCGEHQPDLIRHLNDVSGLLSRDGFYVMILPDHRYCFDHFLPPSRLSDVLGAHVEKRTLHAPTSVLEHRLETTHNNVARHWAGDHGLPTWSAHPEAIPAAIEEARTAAHQYVDVHSWQFTPLSFRTLAQQLFDIGMTDLRPVRVYPTVFNAVEFFAVLQKTGR